MIGQCRGSISVVSDCSDFWVAHYVADVKCISNVSILEWILF